jgi:two-component system KDP operon response regulator KdpE
VIRVLVVDDEPQIRRALAINLRARGYDVVEAPTGEDALVAAADRHPDVVVLDLGLPGIDGIEVVEGIRGWSTVPIVVLSVRDAEADKVAALDAGALRRAVPAPEEPVIEADGLRIDLAAKRVYRAAQDGPEPTEVHLTPTEWGLVEVLARHRGKLVTQKQLLQEVWGPSYGTEANYLRVHMAAIRRKLEPDPGRPRWFVTEPGMGYRFEP